MNSCGGERHRLVAAGPFDPVILPLEGDAGLVGCDQAAVGDGDAMGVARQIGEHGLRPAERPLGIDDPLGLAQRREEGGECSGARRVRRDRRRTRGGRPRGRPRASSGTAGGTGARARARAERSRPAGDPARRHRADMPPPGTIMCTMRMMGHGRAPGVEHGGDADPGAEMLGIGGDRERGLGRRLEQEIVDHGLVLVGDVGDRRRQREHDVEVAAPAAARPRARRAIPWRRRPDTWGNAGCGSCCRR